MAVRVSAPARLHLGLIDLRGDLGRIFGSLGVALALPRFVITARAAPRLRVSAAGEAGERVERAARAFLARYGPPGAAAHLAVEEMIPPHAGLGSGTQIALATGTALARLFDLAVPANELAATLDRGRRSGIGSAAFARGGFAVDGGWPRDGRVGQSTPPVIAWHALPPAWRFVVAIPQEGRGLSGEGEERAFGALPPPSEEEVGRICRLLVMRLLPALVEGEIGPFGAALTEIQALVGDSFATVQGGRFATALGATVVEAMLRAGAAGAGQSSWGPAVFGLVSSEENAVALHAHLERRVDAGRMDLFITAADNAGALVTRL